MSGEPQAEQGDSVTVTLDRIEARADAARKHLRSWYGEHMGADSPRYQEVAALCADVRALVEVAKAAQDTVEAHYETAGWATIAERTKLWDALDAQHAALARLEDE